MEKKGKRRMVKREERDDGQEGKMVMKGYERMVKKGAGEEGDEGRW